MSEEKPAMDQLAIRNQIAELDSEILTVQERIRNVDGAKRQDKYSRFYHQDCASASHDRGPGITFVSVEEAASALFNSMPEPPSREELQAQLQQLLNHRQELKQALGRLIAEAEQERRQGK